MSAQAPALVATCWTSAGDVRPLDVPETSPFSAAERVRAVAGQGWAGLGLAHEDLAAVAAGDGFAALRDLLQDNGISHVEVELGTDWWLPEPAWRPRWELLLTAAEALGAALVKVGTAFGPPLADVAALVGPLRRLAVEAAEVGTRVALEPLPFSMVASIPQGAELVRAVGHPACGLAVDYWHVHRAGTTLAELAAALRPELVVAVELNDADAEVVGTLFEDTRDRRRYCGEGDQDVAGFIATMIEVGFPGPWGVEILSEEHRALPLEQALRRARDTALAAFAAVGRGA